MARGNPLAAFALVADEYEKSGDPIRGLRPIFAPLLSGKKGEQYSPKKFSEDFTERYGISMSPFVAAALADRLVDVGLLRVGADARTRREFLVAEFDWSADSLNEGEIDEVLDLFARWATDRLQTVGKVVSQEALSDAFLSRVARPEFVSIFSDEDPERKKGRLRRLLGLQWLTRELPDEKSLDYLVADFILTCAERTPEIFIAVAKIAQGALMADAVAGLAAPTAIRMPNPPLRVVLDAPLIMDLLDLNTPEHTSYAKDLLEMVNAAQLRVAVFDHSLEEVRLAIRTTLAAAKGGQAFGPLAQRLRQDSAHRPYATLISDTLESRVAGLGVVVLRSGMYEEARYKRYFPEDREDAIRNAIGDLHEHLDARARDAKSVATVARLKQDQISPASLFDAGTIFVTRNSVLVKRVNRALAQGRTEAAPRFCIATDSQFAGFLWFTLKMEGAAISQKRLIANCSSAVVPLAGVVDKMAITLEKINSDLAQEFTVLMTDRRASMYVMRAAIADESLVDDEISIRSLMEMKEAIIEPERQRADAAEERASNLALEAKAGEVKSQETVARLQEVLEGTQQKFDSQLAQLQFELAQKEARLTEHLQQTEDEKSKRLASLAASISARNDKVEAATQRIYAYGWVVAIAASIFSIFQPDYERVWFKLLLAAIYLGAIPFFGKRMHRLARAAAEFSYRGEAMHIKRLEQALDVGASRGRGTGPG